MQDLIAMRVQELRGRLAQVETALSELAMQQQDLMQEALRLQGAIREMESLVIAVPVDGTVVVPEGA